MSRATRRRQESVAVLWMDDEPQTINNYKEILASENKININIVKTIEAAERELESDIYSALVVDFKMDQHDASVNGAEFLKELNERRKAFPTFVYSAWTDDPNYKEYLDQSYALMVESKPANFEIPLMEHPFFKKIYETGKKYARLRPMRPERIRFHDYVKSPTHYKPETNIHWEKHGHWITTELKRKNWMWGVVCGERVVDGSAKLFDYPSEEKLWEIGDAHNLIPFAYSIPLLPEDGAPLLSGESPWAATVYDDDYYPSLSIKIGDEEVIDDFDTGAYQTIVSEDVVKKGLLEFFRKFEAEVHLDSSYEYSTKKVKISIVDSEGKSQTRELPVAVVKEWKESPFTKVNRKRQVLIGRDLLRAFKLEICLDSANRVTRIRFI